MPHSIPFLNTQKPNSEVAYESRDFEDSNLTKHIAEQLQVLKVMMMVIAVLSIFLARIREDAEDLLIFGLKGQQVVLATHSLISVAMSKYAPTQLPWPSSSTSRPGSW